MKKIDGAIRRETLFVAAVVVILSVLMQAFFALLKHWDLSVLYGNLLGAFVAVLNFFLMGIGVQVSLGKEPDEAKRTIRFSQGARFFLVLVAALIGVSLPMFHTVAVVLPLLFPRVAVLVRGLFPIKD